MAGPIEVHFWPTPNGHKITIALEEMGLDYVLKPVNIGAGDQFKPGFMKISPNNRMPAIVDPDGPDGAPISVFESGAILQYLGRKSGKFYPSDARQRVEVEEWLFWQVAGLGPMSGQAGHFKNYAPKLVDNASQLSYGQRRYLNEVNRLYGVIEHRLCDRDFLAGEYSIADMASWPWTRNYASYDQNLDAFPKLKAWHERMKDRPAVRRAINKGAELRARTLAEQTPEELARSAKVLFGQTAASVDSAAKQAGG
ncbi:MAG: glutathione S-transferase N-terminal domain-containing protein [Proteobacteria bacterium]|nr:glutathione S-transferase N-terminal domain-containing protein [Pseudomonadota bacterium]